MDVWKEPIPQEKSSVTTHARWLMSVLLILACSSVSMAEPLTGSHPYMLAYSPATHLMWADGYWHLFYFNGQVLCHSASPDGETWGPPTVVSQTSVGVGHSVTHVGDTLIAFYVDPGSQRLFVREGTAHGPEIDWRPERLLKDFGNAFACLNPILAVASDGWYGLVYRKNEGQNQFTVWMASGSFNHPRLLSHEAMRQDSGAGTSGFPIFFQDDLWVFVTGGESLYAVQMSPDGLLTHHRLTQTYTGVHDVSAVVVGKTLWVAYPSAGHLVLQAYHQGEWKPATTIGETMIHSTQLVASADNGVWLTRGTANGVILHYHTLNHHRRDSSRLLTTQPSEYSWVTMATHGAEVVVVWVEGTQAPYQLRSLRVRAE